MSQSGTTEPLLKALHESRTKVRRLRTENALLRAEKMGWYAERAQLMALIEQNSSLCISTSAMVKPLQGKPPREGLDETSPPPG